MNDAPHLGLLLLLSITCAHAAVASSGGGSLSLEMDGTLLRVEHRVTYQTSDFPEVQVLVHNPGIKDIEFLMVFDRYGSSRPCVRDVNSDPHFERRRSAAGGMQWNVSSGVAPSKGWAHRVYRVGARECDFPCSLLVHVSGLSNGKERGGIEFAVDLEEVPFPGYRTTAGAPAFDVSQMVEHIDMDRRGALWAPPDDIPAPTEGVLLVRTLIRNTGSIGATVVMLDRQLNCQAGVVRWSFQSALQRGIESGPAILAPGDWTVLVSAVNSRVEPLPPNCEASIELGYSTASGWAPAARSRVSLNPVGRFSGVLGPES